MLTNKKRILLIVNNPIFIYQHLLPIIKSLKDYSELYIVADYDEKFNLKFKDVKIINLPIKRNPSFKDILVISLLCIKRIQLKPDLCISFTPKGGFINAFTSINKSKSIHYFTGQRWANFKGIKRIFFKNIDRFIFIKCSSIYCDSFSQSNFLYKNLGVKKPKVIGKGSISGVNINKFKSDLESNLKRITKSKEKNIFKVIDIIKKAYSNEIKIICFIGRLNKDKGIKELIEGFKLHNNEFKDSFLLLIGPNELDKNLSSNISKLKNSLYINFVSEINLILPFAYCLILPSYREGFGSVIIEAAASKIPVIATDIPGPIDFIDHKINGYLIKPRDINSLKEGLNFARNNKNLMDEYAKKSFIKCEKYFSEEYVCNLFIREILKILKNK